MVRPHSSPRAFTLLEVIVTIVVIGIVSTAAYVSFAAVYRREDEHRALQVAEAYESRVRAIAVDSTGDPQANPLVIDPDDPEISPLNAAMSGFTSGAVFQGISDDTGDEEHLDDDGYVTMTWAEDTQVCIDFAPGEDPNPIDPPDASASVPADVFSGPCPSL